LCGIRDGQNQKGNGILPPLQIIKVHQRPATADALEAIADLDIAALADIEPPRGYGRDR